MISTSNFFSTLTEKNKENHYIPIKMPNMINANGTSLKQEANLRKLQESVSFAKSKMKSCEKY